MKIIHLCVFINYNLVVSCFVLGVCNNLPVFHLLLIKLTCLFWAPVFSSSITRVVPLNLWILILGDIFKKVPIVTSQKANTVFHLFCSGAFTDRLETCLFASNEAFYLIAKMKRCFLFIVGGGGVRKKGLSVSSHSLNHFPKGVLCRISSAMFVN